MGLSISILISAWREIFTQRFHTQLCDLNHLSSSSSSRIKELNLIIRRGNSFKLETADHNKYSPKTKTKTPTFKNAKPESIMVMDKRTLSFQDHHHHHLMMSQPADDYLLNDERVLVESSNGLIHDPFPAITLPSPTPDQEEMFQLPKQSSSSSNSTCVLDAAAVKLQKVYKSYRTRRNLADCAVVVEELWWKALDFAALKRSSISFFDTEKQETAVSKWARARTRVAKVGKGLSKNEKAQKLALRHWLEAIDPRHRYGHNLHLYYDIWFDSSSSQPYFYWLDIGDGKEINLENCPRTKLQRQCIQYLGPKERETYEVIVDGNGRLTYKLTGEPVHTTNGNGTTKWIFVLSTTRALYIGEKRKGSFQHSSFLAGAATTAAGRLVVREGVLEAIWPYSGHYLPTEENFNEFIGYLRENRVDLTDVRKYNYNDESVSVLEEEEGASTTSSSSFETEDGGVVGRCGSGGGSYSEQLVAGSEEVVERDNSNKPLSCKWTTGTGPRIGCVRDYPVNLQSQALEQLKLSPRVVAVGPSGWPVVGGPIPSPRPSPNVRVSPRLSYMGLPSPRRNC